MEHDKGLKAIAQGAVDERVTSSFVYSEWAIGKIDDTLPAPEAEELQRAFEENLIKESNEQYDESKLFELTDSVPLLKEAMQVLVDDSFTRCFASIFPEAWNWNLYLYPAWLLGVLVRYCILFPLRLLCLLVGSLVFLVCFFTVSNVVGNEQSKFEAQRFLIKMWAAVFVMSWSGVIRYHGVKPRRGPNQIHVANHSSMIDVIILQQAFPYAIVGQHHSGLVGRIQDDVLKCMGCLWFERRDIKDRLAVGQKITEHIQNARNNPLLIFPEGTCVNNRYCVMFKKGAFALGAQVYPVAIKYNKDFCNPYWHSRRESFWRHLFNLMTCWAVVCDVYYLPPQTIRDDETPVQFANRVKHMIAEKAELVCVPWDGYLKHLKPSSRFVDHRRKLIADTMIRRYNLKTRTPSEGNVSAGSDLSDCEVEELVSVEDLASADEAGLRKRTAAAE